MASHWPPKTELRKRGKFAIPLRMRLHWAHTLTTKDMRDISH